MGSSAQRGLSPPRMPFRHTRKLGAPPQIRTEMGFNPAVFETAASANSSQQRTENGGTSRN